MFHSLMASGIVLAHSSAQAGDQGVQLGGLSARAVCMSLLEFAITMAAQMNSCS